MKFVYGLISAVIIFIGGIIIGKYYFSKIEVVEKKVTKTVYKDKIQYVYKQETFDELWKCYESPIKFKDKTESNTLSVTAYDSCKEATVKYEIGSNTDWKVYACIAGVGAIAGGYAVYKLRK